MPKILTILCFFSLSTFLVVPALAQEMPEFLLPVDCSYGETCWAMNYVDMGPLDDKKNIDPQCNAQTYEGHKGTDIAIRDKAEMDKGVSVLAAMDGKIIRVRDGEPDRFHDKKQLQTIKGDKKECGNAVLIDHGNALQTLYCHLKKNSIMVKKDDEIKAGQKIGEVGLSGYTQFPHLHFGIVWEGGIIDPFTGLTNTNKCGGFKKSLWSASADITYQPISLYAAGFDNKIPALDKIDRGQKPPASFKVTEPILAFWVSFFGVQEGDEIEIEIYGSDKKIFARRKIEQPATRARQFYYTGRKLSRDSLKAGTYTGKAILTRTLKDGKLKNWVINRSISVQEE